MSQHYSNPAREQEEHALPDVEVFYHSRAAGESMQDEAGNELPTGFYYWLCFPGCMPDSDPFGPFRTKAEALRDAQETGE